LKDECNDKKQIYENTDGQLYDLQLEQMKLKRQLLTMRNRPNSPKSNTDRMSTSSGGYASVRLGQMIHDKK
jgi:hypothetical protein